jgi:hypothetical protein
MLAYFSHVPCSENNMGFEANFNEPCDRRELVIALSADQPTAAEAQCSWSSKKY